MGFFEKLFGKKDAGQAQEDGVSAEKPEEPAPDPSDYEPHAHFIARVECEKKFFPDERAMFRIQSLTAPGTIEFPRGEVYVMVGLTADMEITLDRPLPMAAGAPIEIIEGGSVRGTGTVTTLLT